MLAIHIPVLAMLVPAFSLIFLVYLLEKHSCGFRRRCFLTRHLLRSPGESLRVELEQLNRKVAAYVAATLTFPLLIYFACMALVNEHTPAGIALLVVEVIAVTSCIVHVARTLLSLLGQKRGVMMELETKMAVAQELNALMREGYLVFHDVPCYGFNIAHVVVGKAGVYALETRAFAKPNGKGDEENWDVAYSGNTLRFPGWRETSAIEQALFHAVWLQTWLSKAVGEHVTVHPVLVLPGWYIDQPGNGRVLVSNGKNIQELLRFPGQDCVPLSTRKVRQIASQLDLRCRPGPARSSPQYQFAAERESSAEAA